MDHDLIYFGIAIKHALFAKILNACRKGRAATIRLGASRLFRRKSGLLERFDRYQHYFLDKHGIEIGGPSQLFRQQLPIYPLVASLDGCNFSTETVWEGRLTPGAPYRYLEGKPGLQYIGEASNLLQIPSAHYDFLLASHCLEHCANALKTVKEWLRVLKPGGTLLLVLPDRHFTFDHRRPVTGFAHLLADEQAGVDESDQTHLEEILALHDLGRDPLAGTPEQFRARSLDNLRNRCLHQHVFDMPLLRQMFQHLDVRVIETAAAGVSQFILGQKS